MRIWVDVTNSPHVVIFRPLIERMRARGHEVTVTAREFAQTIGLLERFEMEHVSVGSHGGASSRGKALAMAGRSRDLIRFARERAVRPRGRARQHRSADRRTPGRDAAGLDVRLRVRRRDAPLERPPRHPGAGAPGDPRGRPLPVRHPAAQAGALPGPEGGVLPRRPHDGRGRARRAGPRSRAPDRGGAPAPRGDPVPPRRLDGALQRDSPEAARRRAGGADRGAAAHRRAAGGARERAGDRAPSGRSTGPAWWRPPTSWSAPAAP